jgi:hypothetical protein
VCGRGAALRALSPENALLPHPSWQVLLQAESQGFCLLGLKPDRAPARAIEQSCLLQLKGYSRRTRYNVPVNVCVETLAAEGQEIDTLRFQGKPHRLGHGIHHAMQTQIAV